MPHELKIVIKEGHKIVSDETFDRDTRQEAGVLMDSWLQFLSTQDWKPLTMNDGDRVLQRGKQKVRIQIWETL